MISSVNRPYYLCIRAILKAFIRVFLFLKGFRITGGEHLPGKRQPVIVIANHADLADSVYLICSIRPRITICGARPAYFQKRVVRHIFTIANILKVENREQFLGDCGLLLGKGEVILIYPEMGRNPEGLGAFKTWAAEVALAAGTPVIPCYLYGTTRGETGRKQLFAGPAMMPHGDSVVFTQKLREAVLSLKPAGLEE